MKYKIYKKYWFWSEFFCLCDEIQEKDGFFLLLVESGEVNGILIKSLFRYAIKVK